VTLAPSKKTRVLAAVGGVAVLCALGFYVVSVALGPPPRTLAVDHTCSDSGPPEARLQMEDGNDYCFKLPQPGPSETYQDAFVRVYGITPCWSPYELAEDGTCTNSETFYGGDGVSV